MVCERKDRIHTKFPKIWEKVDKNILEFTVYKTL